MMILPIVWIALVCTGVKNLEYEINLYFGDGYGFNSYWLCDIDANMIFQICVVWITYSESDSS